MNERLRHLDGLRAISVVLVFLFHAEVAGFSGGFLGVSVFFTLSGYLLTYRLLDVEPTWRSARRYWAARWRRILPAAIAVLVAVIAYDTITDEATGGARRIWATAFGVSNWLQIAEGNSYANLFAAPDKLVHYWSLAIEEQVYLMLPIVLFAMLRRSRRTAAIGLAVLACTSFVLPVLLGFSLTRTYYGTDARAGEILVGALLALLHGTAPRAVERRRMARMLGAAGLAGMAAIVALAVVLTPTSDGLRTGVLPLTAGCSLLVLHASRCLPGFAAGVLESRPFVALGRLSYPVYLVHWPVLVILAAAGWSTLPKALLGAVITVVIAWPLDRFVERPLRRPRARRARTVALGTAIASLVALSAVAPVDASASLLDELQRQDGALRSTITSPTTTSGTTTTTPRRPSPSSPSPSTPATTVPPTSTTLPPPATVGVFGDSLARSLALVLVNHVPRDEVPVDASSTMLGCGLVNSLTPERCASVLDDWRATLAATPVEVALVLSCQWELIDRDIPGVGTRHVGELEMDQRILAEYALAAQTLLDSGVRRVGWMTCPELAQTVGWPPEDAFRASRDPARVGALNRIIEQLPAITGGAVTVIDLAAWVDPRREDPVLRPDGSHFAWETPTELVAALPALLAPVVRPGWQPPPK